MSRLRRAGLLASCAMLTAGCATRYVATECPPPVPIPPELSRPPPPLMQPALQAIYQRWLSAAPSSTTGSPVRSPD